MTLGVTLQVGNHIHRWTKQVLALAVLAIAWAHGPAYAEGNSAEDSLVVAMLPSTSAGEGSLCTYCEVDSDAAPLLPSGAFAADHQGFTTQQSGQETVCKSCHERIDGPGHPTGVTPQQALPAQFPLNARGELTCTTCHNLEKNGAIRKQAGQSNPEFCETCHEPSFFAAMPDAGASIMMSGHLTPSEAPLASIDSYSLQCMACHAENAPIVGAQTASIGGFPMGGMGAANHSVGADYAQFAGLSDFHPESALPDTILLPEGKVSCVSCHKAYTSTHGERTVARNFCMQCHNL